MYEVGVLEILNNVCVGDACTPTYILAQEGVGLATISFIYEFAIALMYSSGQKKV